LIRIKSSVRWCVDKWAGEKFQDFFAIERSRPSQANERFIVLSIEQDSIVELHHTAEITIENVDEGDEANA
jgi:hypothetical protein